MSEANENLVDPTQEEKNNTNNEDEFLENFKEIKTRYEEELKKRDKEIIDLKKQLSQKDDAVNDAINTLNDEVNEKLKQAEELKALQADVNELLNDKANALVDKYIGQGKLAPAQREVALNLCLADQDMFIKLYENAPSIVEMKPKAKKVQGNIDKMVDYFKN